MMIDILKCPYCHGDPTYEEFEQGTKAISCTCKHKPIVFDTDKEELVHRWNTCCREVTEYLSNPPTQLDLPF
jgi:uncharacterized protein YbaR (Trm112 family)